jgi:Resolvase, N terminal domain
MSLSHAWQLSVPASHVGTLIRPGMFAAFAEFERRLMLERQKAGIAKAKKEGKYKGRKPTASVKADQVEGAGGARCRTFRNSSQARDRSQLGLSRFGMNYEPGSSSCCTPTLRYDLAARSALACLKGKGRSRRRFDNLLDSALRQVRRCAVALWA